MESSLRDHPGTVGQVHTQNHHILSHQDILQVTLTHATRFHSVNVTDRDSSRKFRSGACKRLVVDVSSLSITAIAVFALRCWLCSASADVVMSRVYGALLVAIAVLSTALHKYWRARTATVLP